MVGKGDFDTRRGERTPGGMDNDDDWQSAILHNTIACNVYDDCREGEGRWD